MVRGPGTRTTPPADGFRPWRLASTRGRLPDPGATVADLFAHDGRRAPVGMFDTAPALFARESGNTKLWHNNGAFAGTINPFAPSFPCMAHPESAHAVS